MRTIIVTGDHKLTAKSVAKQLGFKTERANIMEGKELDELSEKEATDLAIATWENTGREPYFHISSPKGGWKAKNIKAHSDYIDIKDFPKYWKELDIDFTVDIEAKDKELAVMKLQKDLDVISQH